MCLSLFCYALLCVHSSFAIILKRKRKRVVLLSLSYRRSVAIIVVWLFLTVPWVGLQYVPVVSRLLFNFHETFRENKTLAKISEFTVPDSLKLLKLVYYHTIHLRFRYL